MIKEIKGINGQIELHEDKIVIKREGLQAKAIYGLTGNKNIPFKALTTIQFKEPGFMSSGFIQFGVLGGIESRGGLHAAAKDENTVMYVKKDLKDFVELKNFLENKIQEIQNAPTVTIQNPTSSLDDLEKLSELLKKGIVTQEEFDAKKKQILGL